MENGFSFWPTRGGNCWIGAVQVWHSFALCQFESGVAKVRYRYKNLAVGADFHELTPP
jgi:hypothetical protein